MFDRFIKLFNTPTDTNIHVFSTEPSIKILKLKKLFVISLKFKIPTMRSEEFQLCEICPDFYHYKLHSLHKDLQYYMFNCVLFGINFA